MYRDTLDLNIQNILDSNIHQEHVGSSGCAVFSLLLILAGPILVLCNDNTESSLRVLGHILEKGLDANSPSEPTAPRLCHGGELPVQSSTPSPFHILGAQTQL